MEAKLHWSANITRYLHSSFTFGLRISGILALRNVNTDEEIDASTQLLQTLTKTELNGHPIKVDILVKKEDCSSDLHEYRKMKYSLSV